MIIRKKKRLKMIIQQQEAKIEKMRSAINACRFEQQMVEFIMQRCNAFEQIDSVLDCGNGVFIITVSIFYNGNGLPENFQFYGYVQEQDGSFSKSHMLHSHFFYHKTYHFLEYVELCSNFSSSQDNSFENLIMEAFLTFMKKLNVEKIKYTLPRNLNEYQKQKLFYEYFGFHINNTDNTHDMWMSL